MSLARWRVLLTTGSWALAMVSLIGCGVAPATVVEQQAALPLAPAAEAASPTPTHMPSAVPSPTPTSPPTATATVEPTTTQTATPVPTATLEPTATPVPPTSTPEPTSVPVIPTPVPTKPAVSANTPGQRYTAYIDAATKQSQAYKYSCEFDAAWVVLNTYGIEQDVDAIIAVMPIDTSIEPRYEQQGEAWLIYGGDIENAYSGDYKTNFLARSTGKAMMPVFEHFGIRATPVGTQGAVQAALDRGELVWMKTTVDFKAWRPARWIMPDGRTRHTVLGNDHAVVVIGYNDDVVVIRDVLGPTSSNWERPTEYEVPWPKFMAAWGAQAYDGLALARP